MGLFVIIFLCICPSAFKASCSAKQDLTSCYAFNGERAVYFGNQTYSASGNLCLDWAGFYTSQGCAVAELAENYCRDPNGLGYPWCMTDTTTREECDIPSCPSPDAEHGEPLLEKCFVLNPTTSIALYKGTVAATLSGNRCQRWVAQTPQSHVQIEAFRTAGILRVDALENFCRDPDGDGRPWCYTTNAKMRWEYCNVSYCAATDFEPTLPDLHQCYGENDWGGAVYLGGVSTTISGRTCQAWLKRQPHNHSLQPSQLGYASFDSLGNVCRDFGDLGRPWCYTTSADVESEFCPVQLCSFPKTEPCVLFQRPATAQSTSVGVSTAQVAASTPLTPVSIAMACACVISFVITVALVIWLRCFVRRGPVGGQGGNIQWIDTAV